MKAWMLALVLALVSSFGTPSLAVTQFNVTHAVAANSILVPVSPGLSGPTLIMSPSGAKTSFTFTKSTTQHSAGDKFITLIGASAGGDLTAQMPGTDLEGTGTLTKLTGGFLCPSSCSGTFFFPFGIDEDSNLVSSGFVSCNSAIGTVTFNTTVTGYDNGNNTYTVLSIVHSDFDPSSIHVASTPSGDANWTGTDPYAPDEITGQMSSVITANGSTVCIGTFSYDLEAAAFARKARAIR